MSEAIKLAVVCGDRSGPFYHDYGIPLFYFGNYNLITSTCYDAIALDVLKGHEIVQFQRQYAPESLMCLRWLKDNGIPTVAHVDDNVWNIPDGNPAKVTYQGSTLDRFFFILHEANAITTNTPYLVKLCKKYNPNVYLFRNLVESKITSYLTPGRDNPDEIRIGWHTTPHHWDDFPPVFPALVELVKNYPQVKLIFIGWLPSQVAEKIDFKRFEYYDFVPVDAFYPCLANLDFDIGIAPLMDNEFNHAKTARKMQEYAILKVPAVVANTPNYREWKHGETCIKPSTNDPDGWYKALRWAIEHKKERDKLADNAYKQVLMNHDINKFIYERAWSYYEIYEQVTGKKHPFAEDIQSRSPIPLTTTRMI